MKHIQDRAGRWRRATVADVGIPVREALQEHFFDLTLSDWRIDNEVTTRISGFMRRAEQRWKALPSSIAWSMRIEISGVPSGSRRRYIRHWGRRRDILYEEVEEPEEPEEDADGQRDDSKESTTLRTVDWRTREAQFQGNVNWNDSNSIHALNCWRSQYFR